MDWPRKPHTVAASIKNSPIRKGYQTTYLLNKGGAVNGRWFMSDELIHLIEHAYKIPIPGG